MAYCRGTGPDTATQCRSLREEGRSDGGGWRERLAWRCRLWGEERWLFGHSLFRRDLFKSGWGGGWLAGAARLERPPAREEALALPFRHELFRHELFGNERFMRELFER